MPYSGEMSDQRTVRVATCNDPAETALIRSVLSAHGIEAIIPGEATPTMSMGIAAFRSAVFVLEEHAEEATELIAGLREGIPEMADEDEDDDAFAGDDALATKEPDVAVVVDRRVRMGATVLLALVVTFGTAHMSTGAWKRGFALAAVEVVGIRHLAAGHRWGILLVLGAVLADIAGAIVRVRKRGAPAKLPTATLTRKR